MKPKPKAQENTSTDEEERPLGIDDLVDDPELRAEMHALEEAGIQDFLDWEESLEDEE